MDLVVDIAAVHRCVEYRGYPLVDAKIVTSFNIRLPKWELFREIDIPEGKSTSLTWNII
jgi:hypothetical protein